MSDCILWHGSFRPDGYGRIGKAGKKRAHRHIWEECFGSLEPGEILHHRCEVKACVNPEHLEVTTRSTHSRGHDTLGAIHRAKTHCPRGHEYNEKNTRIYRGMRYCRACGH